MVLSRPVPVAAIRPGDVIVFTPPGHDHAYTHRVVTVSGPADQRVVTTKGDANRAPDAWKAQLKGSTVPRVFGHVPYVGHALTAVARRGVHTALLGALGVLVAFSGARLLLASGARDAAPSPLRLATYPTPSTSTQGALLMPKHAAPKTENRHSARTLAAAAFAIGALAITGAGVYAGLTADATNTTPETVSSGTLKLTMAAETGAASLTTTVSNMAPGDIDNRFIVLTNSGTLAGKNLGLAVTDGTGSVLSSSATKGLSVSVTRCSVRTSRQPASRALCVRAPRPPTWPRARCRRSAARTAFAGSINPAAGASYNLKVAVHLDGTENVVNGTLPGGTMQGLTATLTYTFSEDQRDAVTTNS